MTNKIFDKNKLKCHSNNIALITIESSWIFRKCDLRKKVSVRNSLSSELELYKYEILMIKIVGYLKL